MLETIRIRKLGYPVRSPFTEFAHRFRVLLTRNESDAKIACSQILASLPANLLDSFQIGKTKVFIRESTQIVLEEKRIL